PSATALYMHVTYHRFLKVLLYYHFGKALISFTGAGDKMNAHFRIFALAGCLSTAFLPSAAFLPRVEAQQRSFYQQTDLKGQEIGKLTGNVYYARMDDYV